MCWEKEEIYANNDLFFRDIFEAIENAQSNIFLETYIFENDLIGKKMVAALNRAVTRGVDVKVIIDAIGSQVPPYGVPFFASDALFDFRVYHPFNLRFFSVLNKRNHRKMCIMDTYIDQGSAWVGSQNITNVHLSIEAGGKGWRDTALFVKGPQVKELEKAFIEVYENIKISFFSKKNALFRTVRLNHSYSARRYFYLDLIRKMKNAESIIWLCTPYFVPNRRIMRRLKKMAKKGVDVRVLLPRTSDVFFMPWIAICFYETLLKSGVKIYEYNKGFFHAKMIMIDTWITIGSTNLNHRSFFHDLEVDMIITQNENKLKAKTLFLEDIQNSKAVTLEVLQKRPLWKKFLGRVLLVFRYFL